MSVARPLLGGRPVLFSGLLNSLGVVGVLLRGQE